jgi:hypothetical protein
MIMNQPEGVYSSSQNTGSKWIGWLVALAGCRTLCMQRSHPTELNFLIHFEKCYRPLQKQQTGLSGKIAYRPKVKLLVCFSDALSLCCSPRPKPPGLTSLQTGVLFGTDHQTSRSTGYHSSKQGYIIHIKIFS